MDQNTSTGQIAPISSRTLCSRKSERSLKDAGISALAILPILGDIGKIGREASIIERAGVDAEREFLQLQKKLASEEGVSELLEGGGKVIAGPGSGVDLRAADRLAREYGAEPVNDFETHAS